MIAGARVEVAPFKEDPMDFVLWKPSTEDQPGWDSPWGRGRPGWHIECSAMAYELLGESFDIHGGGNDLMFPHHENEIAQSCCAHPEGEFARYWLHNEMLQVEGKKMSKSLGNFFTVRDLLDQGVPGEVIRFVFLSTHYRKPMDWTAEKAREAERTINKWRRKVSAMNCGVLDQRVRDELSNDLNTPGAISILHRLFSEEKYESLKASASILGLLTDNFGEYSAAWENTRVPVGTQYKFVKSLVEELIEVREQARVARDWAHSDKIRDGLKAAGIILKDTAEGPEWEFPSEFNPYDFKTDELEALK
jgi:cysteinyl-tRNA synthetase